MSTDKDISQLSSAIEKLKSLLAEQIKLARQGNISKLEVLSSQASLLVEKIVPSGLTERAEFKTDREQLQQLYKELSLVLTSQKVETTEELGRVRRGRKTIETYRTNL